MPMTFTPAADHGKSRRSIGDIQLIVGTITFSGSYATGGEVPTVANPPGGTGIKGVFGRLGVGEVLAVLGDARGNSFEYDNTNDKMKMFSAANTELAAAAYNAALTASPVPVAIIGR